MTIVLNECELGRRLGGEAFLGIQQKGRIDHNILGSH